MDIAPDRRFAWYAPNAGAKSTFIKTRVSNAKPKSLQHYPFTTLHPTLVSCSPHQYSRSLDALNITRVNRRS